jgi:hypothetical protein
LQAQVLVGNLEASSTLSGNPRKLLSFGILADLDFQNVIFVAAAPGALHAPFAFNPFGLPTVTRLPVHFQVELETALQLPFCQKASFDIFIAGNVAGFLVRQGFNVEESFSMLLVFEVTPRQASIIFFPGVDQAQY